MVSSASRSTGVVDPADRLRRARGAVIAGLRASAEPQPVTSPTPIRTLPRPVAVVVAARTEAGLSPVGEDFPRRTVLRRVGRPASGVAGLAVVVGAVALAREQGALLLVALAVLVAVTVVGSLTVRWAYADPLRIDPARRRIVEAASRWTPGRVRTEPGPPRALVATAAGAAQRIVDSPAWRSGMLARGGVVVPLATELDLTEQRAARSRDEDWARLVTRVSALVAYADTVEQLDSDACEPEAADVEVLAFLLSGAIYKVE